MRSSFTSTGMGCVLAATLSVFAAGRVDAQQNPGQAYNSQSFYKYSLSQLSGMFQSQLQSASQSPEDYVVGKFKDHDIVFLGEGPHQVRQNLEFLQSLLPRLYAAGVRNLAYEMIRGELQGKVDQLLNAPQYDESLATDLVMDWNDRFGFQEYRDVLRVAWEINSKLPKGAPRFRIVALDYPTVPLDWPGLRPGEKGGDTSAIQRNLGVKERDMRWAEAIEKEILRKDEKALVYAGAGHTSVRFHWDRFPNNYNQRRAGNIIQGYIGDRVCGISLHGIELPTETAMVERLLGPGYGSGRRFGIDLKPGTPFGDIPSSKPGFLGKTQDRPGRSGGFTLADVTDGYVFLGPVTEWKMVRRIEGAYTPARVREINRRRQVEEGDRTKVWTVADLEKEAEADDLEWRSFFENQ